MFVESTKRKFTCGLGSWEYSISDGDVQRDKLSELTHHQRSVKPTPTTLTEAEAC